MSDFKLADETVETLRSMLAMSFNLRAISDSLHKWDPLGARFNSAWYILNFRIQDMGDKLTIDDETKKRKEEEAAASTKQRRKGRLKKKNTTLTNDGKVMAARAIGWGEATSARFDTGSVILSTGLVELELTAEQLTKEMDGFIDFLQRDIVEPAMLRKRSFGDAYDLLKTNAERLQMILGSSKSLMTKAEAKLQAYYSQYNASYLVHEFGQFEIKSFNMQPAENHLLAIKNALVALKGKALELHIQSFKGVDDYIENVEAFLNLPEIAVHEATAQKLVRRDNAVRRRDYERLTVEQEVAHFMEALDAKNQGI